MALKESPATVWQEQYKQKLIRTILSQLGADRVVITQTAVRSCGYLLQYLMVNDETLPSNLLGPFVRVILFREEVFFYSLNFFQTMNNNNNDVKQLLARVCIHLAKTVPEEKMSPDLLKLLLPTLVNGTKEKNGYVKANSELALIAVLRLKDGDAMQQVL